MSVTALMAQTVTLRKLSGYDRGATGDAEPTFTESTTRMYLEPRSGSEEGGLQTAGGAISGRHTGLGEWFGVGDASVDFDSVDAVVYEGKVLKLASPARPMFNPRSGRISHQEMDLQEIDQ